MASRVKIQEEKRPDILVDLHVYIVPLELWLDKYRKARNGAVLESVSAGFIRVPSSMCLHFIRETIPDQLGCDLLPEKFIFLRSVGRCLAVVNRTQEHILTAADFAQPSAHFELLLLPNNIGHSNNNESLKVDGTLKKFVHPDNDVLLNPNVTFGISPSTQSGTSCDTVDETNYVHYSNMATLHPAGTPSVIKHCKLSNTPAPSLLKQSYQDTDGSTDSSEENSFSVMEVNASELIDRRYETNGISSAESIVENRSNAAFQLTDDPCADSLKARILERMEKENERLDKGSSDIISDESQIASACTVHTFSNVNIGEMELECSEAVSDDIDTGQIDIENMNIEKDYLEIKNKHVKSNDFNTDHVEIQYNAINDTSHTNPVASLVNDYSSENTAFENNSNTGQGIEEENKQEKSEHVNEEGKHKVDLLIPNNDVSEQPDKNANDLPNITGANETLSTQELPGGGPSKADIQNNVIQSKIGAKPKKERKHSDKQKVPGETKETESDEKIRKSAIIEDLKRQIELAKSERKTFMKSRDAFTHKRQAVMEDKNTKEQSESDPWKRKYIAEKAQTTNLQEQIDKIKETIKNQYKKSIQMPKSKSITKTERAKVMPPSEKSNQQNMVLRLQNEVNELSIRYEIIKRQLAEESTMKAFAEQELRDMRVNGFKSKSNSNIKIKATKATKVGKNSV